jgi:hypothetical protein
MSITYTTTICESGITETKVNGKLHSINDQPARIYASGRREWFNDGWLHRDTVGSDGLVLPAVIGADGTREWYKDNGRHRTCTDSDGKVLPAFMDANGDQGWWLNGDMHREGDLPASIYVSGKQSWYKNGYRHRDTVDENGLRLPAVINDDGTQEWWAMGIRVDKPVLKVKLEVVPEVPAVEPNPVPEVPLFTINKYKVRCSDKTIVIKQRITVNTDGVVAVYYTHGGKRYTIDIPLHKLKQINGWQVTISDDAYTMKALVDDEWITSTPA